MQQPQAAVHAEHALHAEHQHHWETSWGPMAAAFGAMFLVPLAFSAYFVYESALLAIVFAGIGAPLTLAGIARWVYEGATIPAIKPNIAPLGIGVFIAIYNALSKKEKKLVITNASGPIFAILKTMGLRRWFTIHPSDSIDRTCRSSTQI